MPGAEMSARTSPMTGSLGGRSLARRASPATAATAATATARRLPLIGRSLGAAGATSCLGPTMVTGTAALGLRRGTAAVTGTPPLLTLLLCGWLGRCPAPVARSAALAGPGLRSLALLGTLRATRSLAVLPLRGLLRRGALRARRAMVTAAAAGTPRPGGLGRDRCPTGLVGRLRTLVLGRRLGRVRRVLAPTAARLARVGCLSPLSTRGSPLVGLVRALLGLALAALA